MARNNDAQARSPRGSRAASNMTAGLVAWASRLSAVVFALALAYTLFVAFSGGLKGYPAGFSGQTAARLIENISTAGLALIVGSAVLSASGLILLWGWPPVLLLFPALGFLFYAGLPYLGIPQLSRVALAPDQPGLLLLQAWRGAGVAFFAAGGIAFLAWAWEQLEVSLSASRRAGRGLKIPFYSPCWQTHLCKPDLRKYCAPGRGGFRKSCWRHKSGCFCDESIGDRMLNEARKRAGPAAQEFFGPPARPPRPTLADRFRSTHHRVEGQAIACAECPIYTFHEVQKHRIASPIMLVAVPALMYYYFEGLQRGYAGFVAALDRFALRLGFNDASTRVLTEQVHGAFGEPIVEYLIYFLIFVLMATFGARFLEWWCFEAKL